MNTDFLKKADEALPPLYKTAVASALPPTVLRAAESLTVDLGDHFVGRLSFTLWHEDVYIDAPVTLTVRFCEAERELFDDFSDYHGWLCRSWLQEDTVKIDFPGTVVLPRRYAARFIRITVTDSPKPVRLSDVVFTAETSADDAMLLPAPDATPAFSDIDRVSVRTLKNCMHRVFEDGPKRDRRLWIGDLRLEALTNYYTFRSEALVRRCLYLFAAAPRDALGFLPGFVYENPVYHTGDWCLQDYSLLYVCTLCDYYRHTGREDVTRELVPVARDIMNAVHAMTDENGIAVGTDVFVDWCEGLEKTAAFMGVYLYTLSLWCELLSSLSLTDEHALYRERLENGRAAARRHLFDEAACAFINAYDREQYSVHATAWLILGGVLDRTSAREALRRALASPDALQPCTPYMHHYTVEALLATGARAEAEAYVERIWGGMVREGADTFYEAYRPGDPDFSPYGDRKVNSLCHAWSCTPAYFIRAHGLGRRTGDE